MLPIQNSWAVEAMIRSYNHVYHVAYDSHYEDLGGVGISYYGKVPFTDMQMEFLAYDPDPVVIVAKVNSYPKKHGDKFVINTFHDQPNNSGLKQQYESLGYEFAETAMILGLPLPQKLPRGWTHVHKIETPEQVEFVNQGLADGNERIPSGVHGDAHIINFYAELEHRAVGWAQLVTACEGVGYINQLYTLPVFRQRGIGTRLLRRVHQEASQIGLKHTILLASELGMQLYRHAGYEPLAYLSVFRPKETNA